MAKHFDLEEQEQLDQLKHFWNQYGNAITWLLIGVLAVVGGWLGYRTWNASQSQKASMLYDEVERAAQAGDVALLERATADIKDRFGRTTFASQAALLAARVQDEKGNADAARASLRWVVDKGADDGYKAVARVRLAAALLESKAYDEALALVSAPAPASFEGLMADRRGDVLQRQGKREEARDAYLRAHEKLEPGSEARQIVEIKLNALGIDPQTLKGNAPPVGASETAK